MSEFKLAWEHFERGIKGLLRIGIKGRCSVCGRIIFDADSYAIVGLHGLRCTHCWR